MEKRCSKCERLLSIKQFNKNKSTKDGLQDWCRQCVAAYNGTHKVDRTAYYAAYRATHKAETAAYNATNGEKKAVYNAVYRHSPRGKAANNAAKVRYRIKHPLKEKCRRQLSHAIHTGKIKRQPCMNGCKAKAEAHHSDYSKPFDVLWLCRKCHRAWHAANK